MSFKDHPVHAGGGTEGFDAVIIGLHDRVVREPGAEISVRRTEARLAKLPPGDWSVVQLRDMDADQLVVGIGGVYAVTTTRLVGKVLVAAGVMLHNGHCTEHLSRVEEGALRLSARLEVTVHPLLVVDAEVLHVREEPANVDVTSSHGVRAWFERRSRA